jgi:Domain of unknown function (DUF4314)
MAENMRRRHPLVGRRVRLVRCTDEHTNLAPGLLGEVTSVDDLGTVHVRWSNGSTLGMIPGEDRWEVLEP